MAVIDGHQRPDLPADVWDGPWEPAVPWIPTLPNADEPDVALVEALDRVLGGLKQRSAAIVRRRLGQSPEGAETLQEIGDSYELSRERIRQIEKAAIGGIRSAATKRLPRGAPRATDEVTARLSLAFRSLRRIERGRYLRETFPDANIDVLARILEACGPAPMDEIVRWIMEFEEFRYTERRRERREVSATDRWARFASGAIWPVDQDSESWFPRTPCRVVGPDGGRLRSTKLGREVEYESGLEARLLRLIERAPDVAEYCEQPFRIDYPWFSGSRVYVPDFAVRLTDGRSLLIEAKPRSAWADAINLAKWNAASRWCGQRGWGFLVADERGHPGELWGAAGKDDYVALEHLTEPGPAAWAQMRRHWFEAGRSWTTLITTSLTYGFAIRRSPFEVWRARKSPWLDGLARTSGLAPT